MKNVITIAGSDPSGGAGIQADLKTFAAHKVYGLSAITAITSQNSTGVKNIYNLPPEIISSQIQYIFEDIDVSFGKIGMISNSNIIKAISNTLEQFNFKNIVLDPVIISKNGTFLLEKNGLTMLYEKIFPITFFITPNIPEAEVISGIKISDLDDMKKAAEIIAKLGPKNILIKGGHLTGKPTDLLFSKSKFYEFTSDRIQTKNTHGTGCTLSSAICSNLALGNSVLESTKLSKNFISKAIETSFSIGKGFGPTHHFHEFY